MGQGNAHAVLFSPSPGNDGYRQCIKRIMFTLSLSLIHSLHLSYEPELSKADAYLT